jgi:hypothetical protein
MFDIALYGLLAIIVTLAIAACVLALLVPGYIAVRWYQAMRAPGAAETAEIERLLADEGCGPQPARPALSPARPAARSRSRPRHHRAPRSAPIRHGVR